MGMDSYGQKTFRDGEIVFTEGDPALQTYLIKAGRVRLWKADGDRAVEIDVIGAGQVFGEMAVISDQPRMASATAVGEVNCISINQMELHRRLGELTDQQKSALNFLIQYCREFLPFELHENRPTDADTLRRDKIARKLVSQKEQPPVTKKTDSILSGLYQALITYAERRLPPQ